MAFPPLDLEADGEESCLRIRVLSVQGLHATASTRGGEPLNPYVTMQFQFAEHRTTTLRDTVEPSWAADDHEFVFPLRGDGAPAGDMLSVEVVSERSVFESVPLGRCDVSFRTLPQGTAWEKRAARVCQLPPIDVLYEAMVERHGNAAAFGAGGALPVSSSGDDVQWQTMPYRGPILAAGSQAELQMKLAEQRARQEAAAFHAEERRLLGGLSAATQLTTATAASVVSSRSLDVGAASSSAASASASSSAAAPLLSLQRPQLATDLQASPAGNGVSADPQQQMLEELVERRRQLEALLEERRAKAAQLEAACRLPSSSQSAQLEREATAAPATANGVEASSASSPSSGAARLPSAAGAADSQVGGEASSVQLWQRRIAALTDELRQKTDKTAALRAKEQQLEAELRTQLCQDEMHIKMLAENADMLKIAASTRLHQLTVSSGSAASKMAPIPIVPEMNGGSKPLAMQPGGGGGGGGSSSSTAPVLVQRPASNIDSPLIPTKLAQSFFGCEAASENGSSSIPPPLGGQGLLARATGPATASSTSLRSPRLGPTNSIALVPTPCIGGGGGSVHSQPGVQPGMQAGVQPGVLAGVQPGFQPGLQLGMQPGAVQLAMSSALGGSVTSLGGSETGRRAPTLLPARSAASLQAPSVPGPAGPVTTMVPTLPAPQLQQQVFPIAAPLGASVVVTPRGHAAPAAARRAATPPPSRVSDWGLPAGPAGSVLACMMPLMPPRRPSASEYGLVTQAPAAPAAWQQRGASTPPASGSYPPAACGAAANNWLLANLASGPLPPVLPLQPLPSMAQGLGFAAAAAAPQFPGLAVQAGGAQRRALTPPPIGRFNSYGLL
eukprot:TRINITY_DN19593_c0_g1_i1.p1 TRINITY_DN19593_c0_g1~~TRINITY_DN19593_c0_g1_i1.p1  ORF type:complete len:844 (-),score=241.92 TRINITY_DN19593_c0_g1_i1:168-2699(-)